MQVIILGAGPAGLAAAYSLVKRGEHPVVLEKADQVGGICRTIRYKDYHFDLGGHRFFTKYDEVQDLWLEILGDAFLERPRLSRIFYQGKFFDYPLRASNAVKNLGLIESARCMTSYARARFRSRGNESSFEEWVSNRFGDRLFNLFFRSYTEKVWGIPTSEIGAEWAEQRIKNMELSTAVLNAIRRPMDRITGRRNTDVASLVEHFYYPRTGPGLMYDTMQERVNEMGGKVHIHHKVVGVLRDDFHIRAVQVETPDGKSIEMDGEHFLSSIPLTLLIKALDPPAPPEVIKAAESLSFRNLMAVNLIIDAEHLFEDNWIYVHDPRLKLGRIQNYKNWSPHMVPDPKTTSLGLEYFCSDHEELWNMSDDALITLGETELASTNLLGGARVTDGCVLRAPKAYPVYKRGYEQHLKTIVDYIRRFDNLQPMGRYGMFKYNNSDHSILTALLSVENLFGARHDVWSVNTETEYHEIRGPDDRVRRPE